MEKLKPNKHEIILEVIGIGMLVYMILYIAIGWASMPDRIPGHFNAAGDVTRWGNKYETLIIPIVAIIMHVLITLISFYPELWNVPFNITVKNRNQIYACIKKMIIYLKLEMTMIFLYISASTIRISKGLNYMDDVESKLSPWFLPIVFIVIFGTIIFYLIKSYLISRRG